jgi:basic membrane protein A
MLRRSFAFAIVLTVAALGSEQPAQADPPVIPLVGFVAGSGSFGDRGLNDEARAGLIACARRTGAHVSAFAPRSEHDGETRLTLLATVNFDQIITLGSALALPLDMVARRFPEKHFAVIDGIGDEPNVEVVSFKVQEAAFLAGALAALVAHGKGVAFLGGIPSEPVLAYESGFLAGVRNTSPGTRVQVRYVGSFDDRDAAARAARGLYQSGTAVTFVVAGPAGFGAIDEAQRAHAYAIGADADQDGVAPGVVLTSVTKNVTSAVEHVCEDTASKKPASGSLALGLAEDGVGLTPFTYTKRIIGSATLARIARLRDAIVAGTIVPPATPQELAAFRRVAIP